MNEQTVRAFVLYVQNSIEKRTGMKNTGLKIPEKDQTYVKVVFSDYYRAKILGKSFSILLSMLVS